MATDTKQLQQKMVKTAYADVPGAPRVKTSNCNLGSKVNIFNADQKNLSVLPGNYGSNSIWNQKLNLSQLYPTTNYASGYSNSVSKTEKLAKAATVVAGIATAGVSIFSVIKGVQGMKAANNALKSEKTHSDTTVRIKKDNNTVSKEDSNSSDNISDTSRSLEKAINSASNFSSDDPVAIKQEITKLESAKTEALKSKATIDRELGEANENLATERTNETTDSDNYHNKLREYNALDLKVTTLEEEKLTLEKNLPGLKTKATEAADAHTSAVKRRDELKNTTIPALKSSLESARAELTAMQPDDPNYYVAQTKVAQLESQLKEAQFEHDTLEGQIPGLETAKTETAQAVTDQETKIEEKKQEIDKAKPDLEKLKSDADTLKTLYEATIKRREKLEETQATLRNDKLNIPNQEKAIDGQLEKLNNKFNTAVENKNKKSSDATTKFGSAVLAQTNKEAKKTK